MTVCFNHRERFANFSVLAIGSFSRNHLVMRRRRDHSKRSPLGEAAPGQRGCDRDRVLFGRVEPHLYWPTIETIGGNSQWLRRTDTVLAVEVENQPDIRG